ncbi:MAG TPA: ATP synthase F1 subunit delta [Micavibrio sp.]|nr:ATP synthase F1 subunit delta [Micavibrio sp.]
MASNIRSSGTAAFRYASALVDLAIEQGAIQQIEQDVADLRQMLDSSQELQTLVRSPLVGAVAQQAALEVLADRAKFSALTKSFLLTLAKNRRLAEISNVLQAVSDNIVGRRGEILAKVESATELTAAQKKSLEESLSKTIGHPVSLDATTNSALIGGVVITLGSLMIDDSIRTKLERMGRAMKHNGKAA